MVLPITRVVRGREAWAGIATAAALLLTLNPAVQGAPNPVGTPTPNPVGTPSSTPGPGMGWGGGALGQRSADARFIVMMIPHHQGAIAMSELALKRARRPEIKGLAQRIITSQSREIAQMRQWYRKWYGTDVPAWSVGAGYGMGMGPGMGMGAGWGWGMPGMATSLDVLKSAPDFDRTFIEQMIPHHRMGVMMAYHAEWNTQHPELRKLEEAMVRVQSQEIEQMAQWYRQWYETSGG